MTALRLAQKSEPVYQFKEAARVPPGVTAAGVVEERERIVAKHGHATARNSAAEVLAKPRSYPMLRSFGPATAEDALRYAMEEGIRVAYRSIVEIVIERPGSGESRPVELRVFHSVPVEGMTDLAYEPVESIFQSPEKKAYLLRKLREDARTFTRRLENVLAELERWEEG